MFKIGDRVIGNERASKCYSITHEGWTGTVVKVSEKGNYITVRDDYYSYDTFSVKSNCFDLYPTDTPSTDRLMELL